MLNRATIVGHVGADPETGATQSGRKWARIRMATTEKWTDKATGEQKEQTEWHTIGVWGDDLIEKVIVPYVKKGARILAEGKLVTQEYEDKTTIPGHTIKRYQTRIMVQGFDGQILLMDRPPKREQAPMNEPEGRGSATVANGHSSTVANGSHSNSMNGGSQKAFGDEIPF